MNYDVIVIGGGPAGCATAITTARDGAKVLLLERGRYPRQKVCGEFISPESVAVLSSLLLADESAQLLHAAPRIATMRILVDGRTIEADIHPPGISLSRHVMDAALWRACEAAGVDARQSFAVDHLHGNFAVTAGGENFKARAVVDASGRWSNLHRESVTANGTTKFVGLKAHFSENSPSTSVDLYFFPGGYCGVQPVADGVVNACALVRADIATKLEDVFQLEPRLKARSASWKAVAPASTTSQLTFRALCAERDGVICVGDAAGFVDPFVGDGISLALQTGVAAAEALSPVWREGVPLRDAVKAYEREYDRRFVPIFRRAARVRRLFTMPRPLRAIAATVAQLPGVTSWLVRLTRAG